MKILFNIIFLLLLSNNYLFTADQKNNNSNNIAVIDSESIVGNSIILKNIKDILLEERNRYQLQINKTEQQLEKKQKDIETKKSILSKEAFEKEQQNLYNAITDLRKQAEESQKELDEVKLKSMKIINDKLNDIIKEYCIKNNIIYALDSSNLLYHKDSTDISAQISKIFNNKFKNISLEEIKSTKLE